MALATQDDLVNAKANAPQPVSWWKYGAAKEAAGVFHLSADQPGFPGAWSPGTPGTTGRATDGTATADGGCIPFEAVTSGHKRYLENLSIYAGAAATKVMLIDLTWVNTGIVVTTTTAQTWTPVAAPARDADAATAGRGVGIALLVTGATTNGAAITGATVSYTNSAGTAGRTATLSTSMPIPATAVQGTFVPFALEAGDVGVQSIEGITLGTSLGAGSVSLCLYRRLTPLFGVLATDSVQLDMLDLMVEVFDHACVFPLELATTTTATLLDLVATTLED